MLMRPATLLGNALRFAGILLIGACAAKPVLNTEQVNSKVIPKAVAFNSEPYLNKVVQWGGKIIAVNNLPEFTQVEVLAYPLNSRGGPRGYEPPIGRFLLRHPGLLDPLDYEPGRWLTSVGVITGVVSAQVGQATVPIAVLQNQQLKLWRYEPERPSVRPQFGIGIGIGF